MGLAEPAPLEGAAPAPFHSRRALYERMRKYDLNRQDFKA